MKKLSRMLIGLIIFLQSSIVFAQTPAFIIKTSPDVTAVQAGSSADQVFLLKNIDEKRSVTIELAAERVDYSKDKQKKIGVPVEWVSFPEGKDFQLKPSEQKMVKAIIKIPENAEEGLYKLLVSSSLRDYDGKESNSGSGVSMTAAVGAEASFEIRKNQPGNILSQTATEGGSQQSPTNKWAESWRLYAIAVIILVGVTAYFVINRKGKK